MTAGKEPSYVCWSPSVVHDKLKKSPVMYAKVQLGYMTSRKKAQLCMREPVWGT
ncbi:hypothetical protein B14911_15167 [Bacillus sp. NRRL B-14911]|uniref:Uncharacterized protein n=1 Tax=Bacillus infantis NRRL B-14911 TaxID=1367477 RepID=U5L756_9BACI|nr:hypothetical protein N288_06460 [Bacillus infantis NRRL B-14911]EAR66719.1 hypothetical protein B14911_15167 [Bacillus sp. NRRL B-14911]